MRNEKASDESGAAAQEQAKSMSLKRRLSSALSSAGRKEAEKESRRRKLFVFFMTDGCDTCNSEAQVRNETS
jgi:hypothetical protein